MRRSLTVAALMLFLAVSAHGQVSATKADLWTSSTTVETTLALAIPAGASSVCVSLRGAGTITAGAAAFEFSDDGGFTWHDGFLSYNGSSHGATSATLAGSMRQTFCGATRSATHVRARLSPAITGTGNVTARVTASSATFAVADGKPGMWTCSLDNIAATLTQCQAAPVAGSGLRLYVTDLVVGSTTATAGQYLIRYGTGTNCGTGTASLFPSSAAAVRYAYPGNATSPIHVRFGTPISLPAENSVCVLCVLTNTCTVQMSGYTAP